MQSSSFSNKSTLDRTLQKPKEDAHLNTFAFLFSEMVQYSQNRVDSIQELENKLANFGKHVGIRLLDLYFLRATKDQREIRLTPMLIFIQKSFWKFLFNREADYLERYTEEPNVYCLIERECLLNKFISIPKDRGNFNCASFTAGIVESILCGSGFACNVFAHQGERGTTYIIKIKQAVADRESRFTTK